MRATTARLALLLAALALIAALDAGAKQPLENMICRTDHKDRGQKTWQVGTQWGNNCIHAWAGKQDMNGADRSDVLMMTRRWRPASSSSR